MNYTMPAATAGMVFLESDRDATDPYQEGFTLSDTWMGNVWPHGSCSTVQWTVRIEGRKKTRSGLYDRGQTNRDLMMPKDNETESAPRRHSGRYIYEELRKQILTLQLKPGVQLDEVSLAAQFGLSRSPVRDALARLITEGLVVILPNRTTLVTPFEIEEFPNYISALDLIQRAVTRLAATQHRAGDLEAIKQADARYLEAVTSGDFQAMSELNKAFHMAIAHAGRNPYFITYYERLLGEGQRLLHLHFDHVVSSASAHRLGRDHDEIIQAIASRDADAAEAAAHEHTMLFQRRFLDYMQQNLTARMSVA